ncbi:MAG: hypothetical protein ACUVQ0_01700 [Thermoproteota archaeon]
MNGVYRIDVPACLLGYVGSSDSLSDDVFLEDPGALESLSRIISVLNWMIHVSHTVYPLAQVDSIARMDRRLYKEAYEPILIEDLRRRGFKAAPRRRSIRDLVLRGY